MLSFIIIAFIIYFGLVKPFEFAKDKLMHDSDESVPPTTEELLTDIRDLLSAKQ